MHGTWMYYVHVCAELCTYSACDMYNSMYMILMWYVRVSEDIAHARLGVRLRQVGGHYIECLHNKMALSSKAASSLSLGQRLWNSLSSWTIKASGYQKLGTFSQKPFYSFAFSPDGRFTLFMNSLTAGLLREDLYNEADPDVNEAIRRLPESEQQLRLFRMKRALDLSMKHSILPKEQWTTPEQVHVFTSLGMEEYYSVLMSWSFLKGCTLSAAIHWSSKSWARGEKSLGEAMRIYRPCIPS